MNHISSFLSNKSPNVQEVITISENQELIIQLAVDAFPELKEKIEALQDQIYLPEKKQRMQTRERGKWNPPEEELLRLIFLTGINNEKYPVTYEGICLFEASSSANKKTHNWLGIRAILTFGVIASATGAINYFNYITIIKEDAPWLNGTNTSMVNDIASKSIQVGLITLTSAAFSFANAMAGLFFTGRYPDTSSVKANIEQDFISALKKEYKNLSIVLEKLYFSYPKLALAIAYQIDIAAIKEIIQREAQKSDVVNLIGIDELESSIDYIKSERGQLPCKQSQQARIFKLENEFEGSSIK